MDSRPVSSQGRCECTCFESIKRKINACGNSLCDRTNKCCIDVLWMLASALLLIGGVLGVLGGIGVHKASKTDKDDDSRTLISVICLVAGAFVVVTSLIICFVKATGKDGCLRCCCSQPKKIDEGDDAQTPLVKQASEAPRYDGVGPSSSAKTETAQVTTDADAPASQGSLAALLSDVKDPDEFRSQLAQRRANLLADGNV